MRDRAVITARSQRTTKNPEGAKMKKLLIAFAGLATLAVAVPAGAQVTVEERVGPGVSVREDFGGPPYGRAWGWRRHHAEYYGDCRVIRERTRTFNGDVIIRTRRVCD